MVMRKLATVATIAAVVALVATACGSSDPTPTPRPTATNPPADTPTSTTAPANAPTATPTPGDGGAERRVQDGDSVAVHYTGTLDNGEVFDSSQGRDPLSFVVGSGQVISGFDDLVRGLAVGETAKARLTPEQAYGERRQDLVARVPKSQAPSGLQPGDSVVFSGLQAVVIEVTDDFVVVDANNRLAGQALTFEIELVSIQ